MLPQKLFFRIGEVAGLVGVEPHVLRYWEREFRTIRPTKSAKGQRVYSRKDVENLLRVRDLLYRDGFTIAGAKKKLQRGDEAAPEPAEDTQRDVTNVASEATLPPDVESTTALAAQPAQAAPATAPAPARPTLVREKLVALRTEIEAYLVELSATGRR
jgi:DNA-binding transcriptional MerR regulator